LIERLEPQFPGWLAFEASTDFSHLLDYRYRLLDDARRFETGSLAFQDQLGMSASIALLMELGIENIWQQLLALQQPIVDWATARGVELASDLTERRRSGILSVRPGDPEATYQALTAAGVVCTLRENAIRLSPHWYNSPVEIERVVEILDSLTK
jgi:selenocysteine lyase/cysteine desulfurase